jgi:uncharacterized protein (TIGR02001 family)
MLTSNRGLFAATLLAGTVLASAPAFAEETEAPSEITVTGSAALTTDYRFRGVGLSGGDPAIQGGITVGHASGFYVGTWSSSIDDGGTDVFGDQELDVFGGWSGEVGSGVKVDAGLLYYVYPGSHGSKVNYFEPYASVSGTLGPASLKVGVAYAWDQKSLGDEDNLYVYANADFAIPETPVTINTHIGYTDGFLTFSGDGNAIDYSIGATASLFGPLSLSVAYVDVEGAKIDGVTDSTVVATLTATF